MFARVQTLFLVFLFAMCASAASVALVPRDGSPVTCNANTGTQQCCNSVQAASDPVIGLLTGLLGIVLGPITGQVGLTCNPITVVGLGTTQCNSQAVCCNGNTFNGLITVGCSPINVNL
ncbi:hypothetical protein H0H87_011299 [Tephrocybe sp. NHM501043]|nr:hypothetical protein H0H87_011299 [Tephrocybe sp. NHM501043]